MAKKVTRTPVEQAYHQYDIDRRAYLKAQKRLEESLNRLKSLNVYPSPIPAVRWKLPDERPSMTRKIQLGLAEEQIEGYVKVGKFADDKPGELFITANKQGSLTSGLLDCLAVMISLAFQYGVPVDKIVAKLRYTKFAPNGLTRDPEIRSASSIVDYIMQWLEIKFPPKKENE